MLRLIYQWRCEACGACEEEVRGLTLYPGAALPWPAMPEGWRVMARAGQVQVVCPAHVVEVIDKAAVGVGRS